VNRQIVKLFAFIVVLFGVLVGFTSYWSVFDAKALEEKNVNKRPLFEQQQIRRGRILAEDGTVLARSVPKGRGADLRYVRRYPNRAVDLTPLADELGMSPFALQVEVERLGRRGLLNLPFIEPGQGGGAELTQKGAAWLIAYEGGRPKDVPAALKMATGRVRAEEEAARLPRSQVYGQGR